MLHMVQCLLFAAMQYQCGGGSLKLNVHLSSILMDPQQDSGYIQGYEQHLPKATTFKVCAFVTLSQVVEDRHLFAWTGSKLSPVMLSFSKTCH
jgi:hypothetical protein